MTQTLTPQTQARIKVATTLTLLLVSDVSWLGATWAVAHGAGLIYAPAGWIAGGALVLAGLFLSNARRTRNLTRSLTPASSADA